VVAYASRKLRKREEKYPTYYLELVVVVHTLKILRRYMIGISARSLLIIKVWSISLLRKISILDNVDG
jgi:hypothetical protein